MIDAGNGWWRCWAKLAIHSGGPIYKIAEANNNTNCTGPGDIYIWGAMAEQDTTQTAPSAYIKTTTKTVSLPRFDYDTVTHAPRGVLIEEVRSNYALMSEDFSDVIWVKVGLIVTSNQTTAPDGSLADQITASAATATIYQSREIAGAGVAYTQSVFVKKGTSDWFYMIGQPIDGPKAWFNIATGTVGTVQAGITSAKIQNIGNGWFRCSIADVGSTVGSR